MSVTIASVILISVTVAVTLAVSSWFTAISTNSMETEELWASDISYQGTSGASDNQIIITLNNPGTHAVTISKAKVKGNNVDVLTDVGITINPGENQSVTLNNMGWVLGSKYSFEFLSVKRNIFSAIDTA